MLCTSLNMLEDKLVQDVVGLEQNITAVHFVTNEHEEYLQYIIILDVKHKSCFISMS